MNNSIVILAFSARNDGNCEQIAEFLKNNTAHSVIIYRISEQKIHYCSNCTYECFQAGKQCPHMADDEARILESICNADQVYFITPNYCGHPPAMLYAFNERSVCYLGGQPQRMKHYRDIPKKFIVISSNRPESFRTAFLMHTEQEPEILWLSAREYGASSITAKLVQIEDVAERLKAFMQ